MSTRGIVLDDRTYRGTVQPPASLEDQSRFKNDGVHTTITWERLPSDLWIRNHNNVGYVTIADAPSFDISLQLSVLLWLNHNDITGVEDAIISKWTEAGNLREWYLHKIPATGEININWGDPADGTYEGKTETDAPQLQSGVWAFIAFTFDNGTVVIYVNGQAVATTDTTVPVSLYNGTANVIIGAQSVNTNILNGYTSLPRIFNYILSPGQIAKYFEDKRRFFGIN